MERTTIMTIEVTVIDGGAGTKEELAADICKAMKTAGIVDDAHVKRVKEFVREV